MTRRRLAHFELEELLGEGAMGQVYRALDVELDRPVALKLLSARTLGDPTFAGRFRREARLAAQLNHPHIATIYSFGEAEGEAYLAMEFVDGETLADVLSRGPLSIADVRKFGNQTASALAVAHAKGIIHRDIKPGNLMLTPQGDIKVMDFGVARRTGETELTMAGSLIGTANIMAPELIQGGEATPAADLFSLGCVLYEMLTGKPAFDGETAMAVLYRVVHTEPRPLASLRPDTPPDLRELVEGLLGKDPAQRLGPAARVAERLAGTVVPPAFEGATQLAGDATTTMVLPPPPPAGAPAAPVLPPVPGGAEIPPVARGGKWRRLFPIGVGILVMAAMGALWLLRPGSDGNRREAEARNAEGEALLERLGEAVGAGAEAAEDSALVVFQAALARDPAFAPAWNNLGLVLLRKSERERSRNEPDSAALHLDQAVEHLKQAAALDAGYALPRYNLGQIALGRGNPAEAARYFEEAARLDPTYADAHWGLARAREVSGDTLAALAHYRRAVTADSTFFRAFNDLGFLYLAAGKPDSARLVLEPAAPRFERAALWKNLGEAFRALGRHDDAERAYRRALDRQPGYGAALAGLARTAESRGHPSAARESWSELLRLDPGSPLAEEARAALGRLGSPPP